LADVLIGFGQMLTLHASQLYGRLAFSIQSYPELHEAMEVIRDKQVAQLTVAEFQAQVADVPSVYARASLVVHLDALVRRCDHYYEALLIMFAALLLPDYRSERSHRLSTSKIQGTVVLVIML
jgi:hypothetical protein